MSTLDDAWALITNAAGTGGTSIVVTTGHGARFPATTVTYEALIYQLADPGINERVRITGRSTDNLTPVTRNIDSRGAQNITASGWAIKAEHNITAYDAPQNSLFINKTNDAVAFAAWVPTLHAAKDLKAGDAIKHEAVYLWTNNTGGAVNFTVDYQFGRVLVASASIGSLTISVPAGTTYRVHAEVMTVNNTAAAQTNTVKLTVYNVTTGLLVNILVLVASTTFDTAADSFHIYSTGQMASASASLFWQGWQAYSRVIRGS